jgi:hypothetical protein
LGLRGKRKQGAGGDCAVWSFMICNPQQNLSDQVKKNEMVGVCGTYGGEETCIEDLVGKSEETN